MSNLHKSTIQRGWNVAIMSFFYHIRMYICTYRFCIFAQVRIKTALCHSRWYLHSLRCITVNTEIPPEWSQRWVLISVSLSWVNMMMWTVINSSSYHLWAWGTGLFMAVVHTFISPGCRAFYLYGSLETKRKRYYTHKICFFYFFYPLSPQNQRLRQNPNEMPCKWIQMDCWMCVHV